MLRVHVAPTSGTPAPAPARQLTVEDSALLAVYQRLAAVDEAIAANAALGKSLEARVQQTADETASLAIQVGRQAQIMLCCPAC